MNPAIKNRLLDLGFALIAVAAGAVVIHFGDKLLGVTLEYYFGVDTFTPVWVLDLFGVPFVAGIVVSLIYGLGGKILAHFSPLVVRIITFYELHHGLVTPPHYATVLPLSFWLLIVVVSAEFAAIGGVVGEIIVKKTYGRTGNKALLHKKFQRRTASARDNQMQPPKSSVEGVDR